MSTYLRMWAWVKAQTPEQRAERITEFDPCTAKEVVITDRDGDFPVNSVDLLEALRHEVESNIVRGYN